jgi:hypothetical protein
MKTLHGKPDKKPVRSIMMKKMKTCCLATGLVVMIGITPGHAQLEEWPDDGNTGLSDPGVLTDWTESTTFTQKGTQDNPIVIRDKRFSGRVNLEGAEWVEFRNCSFDGDGDWFGIRKMDGSANILIRDCEAFNAQTVFAIDGVGAITLERVNIHTCENGIRARDALIRDCYIHDVQWTPDAHHDCIEVYGGGNVIIDHCNLQLPNSETGCVNIATDFGDISDVTVTNCLLNGGTYTIYARIQGSGSSLTDVTVANNVFGSDYIYGILSADITVQGGCNVWEDTGLPVDGDLGGQDGCLPLRIRDRAFNLPGRDECVKTLSLYNQAGRLVYQGKSAHLKWNGLDLSGRRANAGVYSYSIRTDETIYTGTFIKAD